MFLYLTEGFSILPGLKRLILSHKMLHHLCAPNLLKIIVLVKVEQFFDSLSPLTSSYFEKKIQISNTDSVGVKKNLIFDKKVYQSFSFQK